MILDEIFEHGISMEKTVWKKKGNDISRQKVSRMIATDVHPRSEIKIKEDKNGN